MSCMECIGRQAEEEMRISQMKMKYKDKNFIFYVEGPMPEGIEILNKILGLYKC